MKSSSVAGASLLVLLALAAGAQAALSVSNGNFETGAGIGVANVSGWLDYNGGNFWENAWQNNDPNVTPNGSCVVIFSDVDSAAYGKPSTENNDGCYLYQSIGTAGTNTSLTVGFDWGAPKDDPGGRDLGMTVGIYAYDGSGGFAAADNTDVRGASGVTLLDSQSYTMSTIGGSQLSNVVVTLDLSGAGSQELFLRFNSFNPTTADCWPALDNVELNPSVLTNVPPAYTQPLVQAEAFGLDRIRLLDSRFKDMQELHRTGYLAWLDPDRLLYPFRYNAGLDTLGSSNLGGWESVDGFTRGHMAGHYLSGASKMYAATGDTNYLGKIQYIVDGLKQCQDALGAQEVAAGRVYGYLSAFPSDWFYYLETDPHNWNVTKVPFYTIHKILAGLIDAYKYCGIDEALDIAIDMSDYHSWRVSQLTDSQIEEMFRTDNGNSEEWGGMNEALTELYLLSSARGDTNAVRHLDFAKVFERDWFIDPLVANTDQLSGLHANTHVPQVVGFSHLAAVLSTNDTERVRLYTAADNFWHMVTEEHSFALGGNSFNEHFADPGVETGTDGSALASIGTSETCNTYNMLKLTGELMQQGPTAEYADYYERALYNHILASISPETGMATYYVSLRPGHFKTYGLPEGSCWCCTGTGLENPGQYGQYIYQHKDDTLWVNLYIPSTLDWSEQGIGVTLTTDYPNSDQIQLALNCVSNTPAKICLRIPGWINAPAGISVNGVDQGVAAAAGSYAELNQTWHDGDVISLTLPMGLRLDRAMDDATEVALFYGPVLLAGDLGTDGLPGNNQQATDMWAFSGYADPAVPSLMASNADQLNDWVHSTSTSLVFTADAALVGASNRGSVVLKPFYDTHHTRYTVYWNLMAPAAFSTWNGGGLSSVWADAGNWDTAPTNDYGLNFAAAAGGTSQNDLTPDAVISGLNFPGGAGAFSLEGHAIGLQGDVVNASTHPQTINLSMALQGGFPWYFDTRDGDIILGGALNGSGVLVKKGTHTLHLLSSAAFAGSIHVDEGRLEVGDGGTTGSLGATPVSLATNTLLVLDRSDTFDLDADVSGDGTIVKRGGGMMNLLASLGANNLVVEGGSMKIATAPKQILSHRWSFNGDLNDSVGGITAQEINLGANNTTLTSSDIALAGGARDSSDYVQLGSNLLPRDGSPVTIELWATQSSVQNWSRIFDVGASQNENLFMSWDRSGSVSLDRIEWKDTATTTADDSCAPYTAGTEYHIVMVIEPGAGAGGTTRVTWYAAPSGASSLGPAKGSFDTGNTLATLNDVNFWLGRSEYGADNTASARYDEVRIWNYALGTSMLEQLHGLGPDDLGGLDAITVTGSLSPGIGLDIRSGAGFDLSGSTLHISSLSGPSNAVVNLGSGGNLVIDAGGNASTVFGGTVSGSGNLEVDGTLRLVGDAALPAGITLVNNGLLDIMTWNGTLPAGFVNNGSIIDRSMMQIALEAGSATNILLQVPAYAGHSYQFQSTTNLNAAWTDFGPSHTGNDEPITQEATMEGHATFYRLQAQP